MKRITVVTAFDNLTQFEGFKNTVISASIRNSHKEISFLTVVKNYSQKKVVENFYKTYLYKYETDVVVFWKSSPSVYRDGQIYWLFSPFFVKRNKYIIQLDNDTLINCKLSSLIDKTNYKNVVSGVKIKPYEHWPAVQSSITKMGQSSFEKYSNNWINGGITLINTKLWIKAHKTKELLWKKIAEISLENEKNEFPETDESLIFDLHFKDIGRIKRRYNLRFHTPVTTSKFIKSNDFILHYFLYNKYNGSRQKFDFLDHFKNLGSNNTNIDDYLDFSLSSYKLKSIIDNMDRDDLSKYLKTIYLTMEELLQKNNELLEKK